MEEEKKPFACNIDSCTMSFTNEDHLNVHQKKHDMVLNFGLGSAKSGIFLADQTPTPTRLIRNCDEVGLFDDLNPFDETFRRAVESKDIQLESSGNLLNPLSMVSDDTLHTPHVMPLFSIASPDNSEEIEEIEIDSTISGRLKCEPELDMDMECDTKDTCLGMTIDDVGDSEAKNCDELYAPLSDTSTHSVSQETSTVNRASVIYVPHVPSVVQPISRVICETPLRKYKAILPLPQKKPPQVILLSSSLVDCPQPSTGLKKIYPKSERNTSINNKSFVKEKLKETLLKIKGGTEVPTNRNTRSSVTANTSHAMNTANKKTTSVPATSKSLAAQTKPTKRLSSSTKFDSTDHDMHPPHKDINYEKNRAAAAARRYRVKFKNEHNELKRKNIQLEEENRQLKLELKTYKTVLLAHQDCSVSKSMRYGPVYSIATTSTSISSNATNGTTQILTPVVNVNKSDQSVYLIINEKQ